MSDLRFGARTVFSHPTFAAVVILTLGLGIGASTAIFSAVMPILIEPLPYPDADRVVKLADSTPDGAPLDTAYGNYVEVSARSRSFDALAVADRWLPALVEGDEPERLTADRVSADYFDVLGVRPSIGRDFETEDMTIGGPRVAIISDKLAKRRFGGARGALDRRMQLDGYDYRIVGVMPDTFENVLAPQVEVWSPLRYRANAPFESGEWGHHLRMVGRLRPGVTLEDAQREIAGIGVTPTPEFPRPAWADLERGLSVESLQDSVTAGARPAILGITGAVMLLLALACANVANLLLARGLARRNEIAVRAALGAGRPRLVRQLVTESLVVAFLGGAVGFAFALLGVRAIVALAPAGLPRVDAVVLEPNAFFFALAVTTLTGLAVGLAPALIGTRPDLRVDLHTGLRATAGSPQLFRRGLVVVEVALALVLLTGTGLLLRSVERLLTTETGFESEGLLTMQIVTTGSGFETDAETMRFFESALEAVRAVPGVVGAAFSSQLPLSGDYDAYGVNFESDTRAYPQAGDGALRYIVTPTWFRTMGIPLLEGRLLDSRDRPGAPRAVVLSESFAERRFGGASPIGERLRIGPENSEPERDWDIVVGVVADVKQASLGGAAGDAFYMAMGQWTWIDMTQSLVVRTTGDAAALASRVQRAIASVNASAAIARVTTMEDLVASSEAQRRFVLDVFAGFAAAALIMAGLGLYGVVAGSVVERTREIGLRTALGAGPRQIQLLVMRQGMTLAALGILLGLTGTAAASRGLESLLYGVTAADPLTLGGVIGALAIVAAAACWIPARHAARVDPTTALRSE